VISGRIVRCCRGLEYEEVVERQGREEKEGAYIGREMEECVVLGLGGEGVGYGVDTVFTELGRC
jgi:hypothetical protein